MGDLNSRLPEELVCHILSFLPTKQAVATRVLSKKWKSLWRSVPTLDFDDADYHTYTKEAHDRFVRTVYAALLSRDVHHHPIKKFRICFSQSNYYKFYDSSNVSEWVNAATQRVEHLDISLGLLSYLRPRPNLSSMFTCKTLMVLKLENSKLEPISLFVDLPSLKVLHLQDLRFSKLGCLAHLLSGCPLLEDFKATDLDFHDQHVIDKEFKTLPKLLKTHLRDAAHINFLLQVVNNVKFLRIDGIHYSLSLGECTSPFVFPMFHNLTHLELVYRYYNDDWSQVVELLEHCPKLQVLVINQLDFHIYKMDGLKEVGDWQYPQSEIDPECILLHIKRCYLNGYRGAKGEFKFARYILRNGRFLEKMEICSCYGVGQEEELEMLKKLSSCTRCSATCKLFFK